MTRGRLLAIFGLLLGAICFAAGADARVEGDSEYTKAQTYSTALRYLRVDLGFEVFEKDPRAGYLLFHYIPPGQPKQAVLGSVEVVEANDHVRVFVQIPSMPSYHEVVLRDGLFRKLRDEYGPPAPRKPEPPEKEPPGDAGADSGSD